jgi:hypothetical protein
MSRLHAPIRYIVIRPRGSTALPLRVERFSHSPKAEIRSVATFRPFIGVLRTPFVAVTFFRLLTHVRSTA